MKKKKKSAAEAVEEYGRAAKAEFSVEELLGHLRKEGFDIDEDDAYGLALSSVYLFEKDPFDERFVPRHAFFQGAQFRITPLKEEVEGGFVVPGHRFMPFLASEVFPADARLALPDGSALRTRTISMPQELAMRCLHFFGPSNAIDYLLMESEENAKELKPPFESDIQLTVFDLRDFFAQTGFRLGDSLMLTVVDWLQGVFSVERVPPATNLEAARSWIRALRLALDDAMDELGPDSNCHEQLALTVYLAQYDPDDIPLAEQPPLSIAAAMNAQEDLAVKTVYESGVFWKVDEDPIFDVALDAMENPPEPDSELDAFFQMLGLSIIEVEAEAYMRDALHRGCTEPMEVLARVVAGRKLFFDSAEDQEKFHDLWAMLWDDVRQVYSPQADPNAQLRSGFLELNDKCLAILRWIDGQGLGQDAINNPALLELGRLNALVSSALALFNFSLSPEEIPAHFHEMLPMLDETADKLARHLMEGKSTPSDGTGKIYQLKISLKGSKPPIWRRILISADAELTDLHHAIQAAMGWYNCHLHQFKQGRTCFQPNPDPEFAGFGGFDDVDSAGVQIGDLLLREKDKIDYEYDFGDGWEHVVLLEKILEPEEGQAYPACIKGKRACPPEDCGGLWGYYNLLEVLDNPKDEEYESMLEWVGGKIDPEAFDLAEANARLKRCF